MLVLPLLAVGQEAAGLSLQLFILPCNSPSILTPLSLLSAWVGCKKAPPRPSWDPSRISQLTSENDYF